MGLVLCLAAPAVAAAQAQTPPAYTMPNTEVRVLPVTPQGRHYQLYVALPGSYGTIPGKTYPVVYVTDGYWDFIKIVSISGSLVYDRVAPEFITVGIGYAGDNLNYNDLRRWELSPTPLGDGGDATGHAADFLASIKSTIIPYIDAEYQTDPSYRVLAGLSMGGLFTLYAMLDSPDTFQGYVAATPYVGAGDDWLFRFEEQRTSSGAPPRGRLYMTVGGNESPDYVNGVIRFNQRLSSRRSPDFAYSFRFIEDERHSSAGIESYIRGLRFAFAPRAPETGPVTEP